MNKAWVILAAVLAMIHFAGSEGIVPALPAAGTGKTGILSDDSGRNDKLPAEETIREQECGVPQPNSAGVYRVIVTDNAGNPIPEADVQFCSDTACRFGVTDEDGVAEFKAEEGPVYSVQVVGAPDGYEEPDTEYTTLEQYCDIRIVLQKAAE